MTMSDSKKKLYFYCTEHNSIWKHIIFAAEKKKETAVKLAHQKNWTLL